MKRLFAIALVLFYHSYLNAQTKAVTDTGEEVLLYDDGTWKYTNEKIADETEIKVNDKSFTKDDKSSFVVKSSKVDIGIWINPKDWNFSKNSSNEDAEFQFQKKGEDLYGMLIAEKLQIPITTLRDVAIQNARNVSTDMKVIHEEYRNVNGIKVLMMQMAGTIQGMRISYLGYYYSNESGTIQLLTYTGESLLNNYKKDIEIFLNGLVAL